MNLSPSQVQWGFEKLEEFRNKHRLTRRQAAKILNDVETVKGFYDWVNADEFLCQYIAGLIPNE